MGSLMFCVGLCQCDGKDYYIFLCCMRKKERTERRGGMEGGQEGRKEEENSIASYIGEA